MVVESVMIFLSNVKHLRMIYNLLKRFFKKGDKAYIKYRLYLVSEKFVKMFNLPEVLAISLHRNLVDIYENLSKMTEEKLDFEEVKKLFLKFLFFFGWEWDPSGIETIYGNIVWGEVHAEESNKEMEFSLPTIDELVGTDLALVYENIARLLVVIDPKNRKTYIVPYEEQGTFVKEHKDEKHLIYLSAYDLLWQGFVDAVEIPLVERIEDVDVVLASPLVLSASILSYMLKKMKDEAKKISDAEKGFWCFISDDLFKTETLEGVMEDFEYRREEGMKLVKEQLEARELPYIKPSLYVPKRLIESYEALKDELLKLREETKLCKKG